MNRRAAGNLTCGLAAALLILTGCARPEKEESKQGGIHLAVNLQSAAGTSVHVAFASVKVADEAAVTNAFVSASVTAAEQGEVFESIGSDIIQALAPVPGSAVLQTDDRGGAILPETAPTRYIVVLAAQGPTRHLWIVAASESRRGLLGLNENNRGIGHLLEFWRSQPALRRAMAGQVRVQALQAAVRQQWDPARRLARAAQILAEPEKETATLAEIDRLQVAWLRQQAAAALAAREFEKARDLVNRLEPLDAQQAGAIRRLILEEQGGELRALAGHSGPVRSVAFTADGARALSGSADNSLKLWDAATGQEIRAFRGHRKAVNSVAFAPGDRRILSGSDDGTIRLWDAETGGLIREYGGLGWKVSTVAFSPDGRWFASGGEDNRVQLWDAASDRPLRAFSGHSWKITSVAFSPDGRTLLSGSEDNTARLWDANTGQELRRFDHGLAAVTAVAISSDGRLAATAGADKTIKLWDLMTGREVPTVQPFRVEQGAVRSVGFSLDGRWLASGGDDGTVRLWDVVRIKILLPAFAGHRGPVRSVAYSRDGRRALSGGDDQTVKLWQLPREVWPAEKPAVPSQHPAPKRNAP